MPAGNSVEEKRIREKEKREPCICVQENTLSNNDKNS